MRQSLPVVKVVNNALGVRLVFDPTSPCLGNQAAIWVARVSQRLPSHSLGDYFPELKTKAARDHRVVIAENAGI